MTGGAEMKAGEIYTAPSGKKYKAISDETRPQGIYICDYCDCTKKDCGYSKCIADEVHFKLIKEDKK